MRRFFAPVAAFSLPALLAVCALAACVQVEHQAPNVDYMELSPDYARRAPVDVAILKTEALMDVDADIRGKVRQCLYDLMMEKGYAPLSFSYVDGLMRDKGAYDEPLSTRYSWDVEPCRGMFFCDGIMAVSIESFHEPGRPGNQGIEIWGKVAIFDAGNLEVLYEHYIRRTLFVTDPGSREAYLARAVKEFTRDLLNYLPDKPGRSKLETAP